MNETENTEGKNSIGQLYSIVRILHEEVADLNKRLINEGIAVHKVYTNKAIKELLGIGDKTLQRYRDEGKLRFHQDKDKFWYTQADVDEFLANNEVEPYAYAN